MKSLDLDKIDGLFGVGVASSIRRMEHERASLMKAMTQSQSLTEKMKKLVGETSLAALMAKHAKDLRATSLAEQVKGLNSANSLAIQMANQWQASKIAEQESIRRMLDPLQDIRKGLLADSATKRVLEDLAE